MKTTVNERDHGDRRRARRDQADRRRDQRDQSDRRAHAPAEAETTVTREKARADDVRGLLRTFPPRAQEEPPPARKRQTPRMGPKKGTRVATPDTEGAPTPEHPARRGDGCGPKVRTPAPVPRALDASRGR